MKRRLLDRLFRCAEEHPDRVLIHAYRDADTPVPVGAAALLAEARRRAGRIAALAREGDLVLIVEHNPLEQIRWWLGAVLAGTVPGILTPPTPKLDMAEYRRDLEILLRCHRDGVVVRGDNTIGDLPEGVRSIDASDPGGSEEGPAVRRPPEAALLFQQSSGTTGPRKGILLSEAAVVRQVEVYGRAMAIGSGEVIVSWLPLYHDMGLVAAFLMALHHGIPLAIISPFGWLRQPDWLFRAIHRHRGTLCWLPNFAFDVLSARVRPETLPEGCVASLRALVNCSEPVLPHTLERFLERFGGIGIEPAMLSSCYAMAENTFAVTQTPPGRPVAIERVHGNLFQRHGRAVPVAGEEPGAVAFAGSGQAISGTQVRIVRDGLPVPDGEVGQIQLSSDCMMDGYVGVGAGRAVVDGGGWLLTGDRGYTRNGELFVTGRQDDAIIRAGRNIDPAGLEDAANGVLGVKPGRVAAVGIPNAAEGTEEIVLLVEHDETVDVPAAIIASRVTQACITRTGLAPQRVEVLPPGWLRKSSSGKIARARCRARYLETASGSE